MRRCARARRCLSLRRAICLRCSLRDRLRCWPPASGITPLYTMALHLDAAGTPFELHYYVKRRENAAFVGEMAKSSAMAPAWSIVQMKGKSPRSSLADTLGDARADHHLYLCGPSGFMDTARRIAAEKKLARGAGSQRSLPAAEGRRDER